MTWTGFPWNSLKARIALVTVTILVIGLWVLSFTVSRVLRADLERQLGEQQFSTTSFIARDINSHLLDRHQAVQAVAAVMGPATHGNAAALQAFLEQRVVFVGMFNAGVFVTAIDGTTVADAPKSMERLGINYLDLEAVRIALTQGQSQISLPIPGEKSRLPILGIVAPISDQRGNIIGALVGAIDLAKPNFLDQLVPVHYGEGSGFALLAPQNNLIVSASDSSRSLQPIPSRGLNLMLDKYLLGYEGYGISVNSQGLEELSSAKSVPVAGWLLTLSLSTDEAFAPIRTVEQHILIATILLSLLSAGLIWWITSALLSRQIAPILATTRALVSVPETGRAQPLSGSNHADEVTQLIDGFNRVLRLLYFREDQLNNQIEHRKVYESIVSNMSEGVLLVAADTVTIVYANPRYEQMLGYAANELIGLPASILIAPNERTATEIANEIDSVLSSESYWTGDVNFICKDGHEIWCHCLVNTIDHIDYGKVWLGVVGDVTEIRKAQLERDRMHVTLRNLSDHLQASLEAERRELARDIHDQLGAILTGVRLRLETIIARTAVGVAPTTEELGEISRQIGSGQQAAREICTRLRPSVLDDLGLIAACRWVLRDWASSTGLRVNGEFANILEPHPDVSIDVFRCLQELLTNIARHAGATRVQVVLTGSDQELSLQVSDDGHGFASVDKTEGYGLLGIRERAGRHRGALAIVSSESGTAVTVTFAFGGLDEIASNNC
ncbi:MAG TPA: PAS domain S-box protein [Burkholderiaceae bacterium]|nr:PAS domain S-box protein [Burkholderiaceae bacterium]